MLYILVAITISSTVITITLNILTMLNNRKNYNNLIESHKEDMKLVGSREYKLGWQAGAMFEKQKAELMKSNKD